MVFFLYRCAEWHYIKWLSVFSFKGEILNVHKIFNKALSFFVQQTLNLCLFKYNHNFKSFFRNIFDGLFCHCMCSSVCGFQREKKTQTMSLSVFPSTQISALHKMTILCADVKLAFICFNFFFNEKRSKRFIREKIKVFVQMSFWHLLWRTLSSLKKILSDKGGTTMLKFILHCIVMSCGEITLCCFCLWGWCTCTTSYFCCWMNLSPPSYQLLLFRKEAAQAFEFLLVFCSSPHFLLVFKD